MPVAEKGSFWTSTATILTAIGTLLAGFVALATFIVSQDWFGGTAKPPGDAPSHIEISNKLFWGPDEISLDDSGSIDLDKQPPDRDTYTGDIYLTMRKTAFGTLFLWNADSTPSASDCATYLSKRSTSEQIPIDPGSKICAYTDEGRYALLVFKETGDQWLIEVTVWAYRDV